MRRTIVVAAFPILLSISVSNERLSVMVEPVLSSQSSMMVIGGASVIVVRTFVFFRLMVSPKSLHACEKRSDIDWSSCCVWVATATLSANNIYLARASALLFGFEAGEVAPSHILEVMTRRFIRSASATRTLFTTKRK